MKTSSALEGGPLKCSPAQETGAALLEQTGGLEGPRLERRGYLSLEFQWPFLCGGTDPPSGEGAEALFVCSGFPLKGKMLVFVLGRFVYLTDSLSLALLFSCGDASRGFPRQGQVFLNASISTRCASVLFFFAAV